MLKPHDTVASVLNDLRETITQLSPVLYSRPISTLQGATLGAHVRHILDMYQCLEKSLVTGIVNYELRERDLRIETDPAFAIQVIDRIIVGILNDDRALILEGSYNKAGEGSLSAGTSYSRELLYNLDHTIHHMAMIRIGLDVTGTFELSSDFGVAPSTVKYRKACAQ